jgi:hypothetical protein
MIDGLRPAAKKFKSFALQRTDNRRARGQHRSGLRALSCGYAAALDNRSRAAATAPHQEKFSTAVGVPLRSVGIDAVRQKIVSSSHRLSTWRAPCEAG